jgi:hypothetical protein
MHRTIAIVSVILFAAACGRGAPVQLQPQPLSIDERVFYDENAGLRDSTAFEIRDRAALEQTWQQIMQTRRTPPQLSDVPALATFDFQRSMLLVVTAGRLTRGDRLRIESVGRATEGGAQGRQQEVLKVYFSVVEGCRTVPDAAYPVEIVRVPRYNGIVRYEGSRSRATNCE